MRVEQHREVPQAANAGFELRREGGRRISSEVYRSLMPGIGSTTIKARRVVVMKFTRLIGTLLLLAGALAAQPKRILYITLSAGFRHESIPTSIEVLKQVAARSGKLEI